MELNCLFEKHYNELLTVSLRITGNKTDARDLISESFIDIVEQKKRPPVDAEGFIKWMGRYLKLHYISKYGRFKKQKTGTEKPIDTWKEPIEEENDFPRILSPLAFIQTLDALDRVLFELIYERELSYSQIIKLYKERGFEIKRQTLHKLTQQLKQKINDTKRLKLYRLSNSSMAVRSWCSPDSMAEENMEN